MQDYHYEARAERQRLGLSRALAQASFSKKSLCKVTMSLCCLSAHAPLTHRHAPRCSYRLLRPKLQYVYITIDLLGLGVDSGLP